MAQLMSYLSTINNELKLKVQELRFYETIFMQSIHIVKSLTNNTPTSDVNKLDETTCILSIPCDAFIQTFVECVKLATDNSNESSLLLSANSNNTSQINKRILFNKVLLLV
ncbi:unnamed protein product [Rotaria sp. Silwood1]|nr:unnamed protein product [Rotaria sp. Silwood1]CAF1652688.1 unnamed protein product [Rotaria sp. Silwood1]CAF3380901.1 unnamed protein product [Rotaria sp. Silwood1]CAF3917108.1 unnamed protein product [Rotaria sp. Silwood1]CAF4845454.1 unnamed protein product [Rotaria sp. Silwood1]